MTVYGTGEQTRSLCYVIDLFEGLIRLMNTRHETIHQPVNLGNSGEFTMNELANQVAETIRKKIKFKHLPLPKNDPKQRQLNITRAQQILDWELKIPLRAGLKRAVEYFAQNVRQKSQAHPNSASAVEISSAKSLAADKSEVFL